MACYEDDWHQKVRFELLDASKIKENKPYTDMNGKHISHIYSYNKVMSFSDRRGIAKVLNKTNYKLMTWYFSPKESAACGLKRFKLAHKMPMQSTGREKFTAYIYFKTELYDEDNEWSDEESDVEEDEDNQDMMGYDNDNDSSDLNDTVLNSAQEEFQKPNINSRNKRTVKAERKAATQSNLSAPLVSSMVSA